MLDTNRQYADSQLVEYLRECAARGRHRLAIARFDRLAAYWLTLMAAIAIGAILYAAL